MFSPSHAGEVGRALAAGFGRALGENLLKVMLIDPDIGRPVTLLSLVENARYTFQRTTRAGSGTSALTPLNIFKAERVADDIPIQGKVGNG